MQHRDEVELTEDGVPGVRAFYLVDERGSMISATRLGPLVAVVADHHAEAGTLALRFPDGAVVALTGNVGRCAATTRQPDTGVVDFKTLHHLKAYRGEIETTEPLPFGVHARVLQPGRVRLGDAVSLA